MMNTPTVGPQRDDHLPAAFADLHLRRSISCARTHRLLCLPPLQLRPDALAAVLHADLREHRGGRARSTRGTSTSYSMSATAASRDSWRPKRTCRPGRLPRPRQAHSTCAFEPGSRSRASCTLSRPEQTYVDAPLHVSTLEARYSEAISSVTSTNFRYCSASCRCSGSSRFPSERTSAAARN